ncbi:probable phosphatase 2C 33 [Olea europaea subsp. europaea]|uniref:Probable phosphatase 2C 33 n=1 Tax=Olea europaea subsp. europaea TaxID=158383 RepID=A0A8S0QNJ2_OLEEU|nr:probable phosphatase 2C 33 [Olea europaea subsp. europaea]
MVAKCVRDSFPVKLSANWEANIKNGNVLRVVSLNTTGSMKTEDKSFSAEEEARAFIDLEETRKHPEIFQTLKESFLKAFKVMDWELRMFADIDCFCRGTTAVTLVKRGQNLVIGNVGDSRAVLGTRDQNNSLVAVQLTVDLKPNLLAEAERIRKCKGRIFALQAEPEVARVWLPHSDSPGLAMARAFGVLPQGVWMNLRLQEFGCHTVTLPALLWHVHSEFCLKEFGIISVPEIFNRCIIDKDEFVVLATDGIWDVLSNKEVVHIVGPCTTRSYAARQLVSLAVWAWILKYPTSKVDDCAVCLFLDSDFNNPSFLIELELTALALL